MSFFIFAEFLKKALFPFVGYFGGNPPPSLPLAYPPPPVPNQAEKPEDQQSPETIENTRKIKDFS